MSLEEAPPSPPVEQPALWRGTQMTPPPGQRRSSASSRADSPSQRAAAPPFTPVSGGRDAVGVCQTPGPGRQSEYKYYCPICTYHFKGMLRTHCCAQYMCVFCVQEQMQQRLIASGYEVSRLGNSCSRVAQQKGAEGFSPDELFSIEGCRLPPVECPFCFTSPFLLHPVTSMEKVRAYYDSPSVKRPEIFPGPSPVRAGADWDELTRKMRPLPLITDPLPPPPTSASSSSRKARPRRPLAEVSRNNNARGVRPPTAPRQPTSPPDGPPSPPPRRPSDSDLSIASRQRRHHPPPERRPSGRPPPEPSRGPSGLGGGSGTTGTGAAEKGPGVERKSSSRSRSRSRGTGERSAERREREKSPPSEDPQKPKSKSSICALM